MWPHRWQPTRLPRPWDSPGKNTRVGCHFLLQCMKMKSESEVTQPCATLCNPMDCSLPGSSVHGIFQARVLEWGAIAAKLLWFFILTCHFKYSQHFFSSQIEHLVSLGVKYIPFMCLTAYSATIYIVLFVNLLTDYTVILTIMCLRQGPSFKSYISILLITLQLLCHKALETLDSSKSSFSYCSKFKINDRYLTLIVVEFLNNFKKD